MKTQHILALLALAAFMGLLFTSLADSASTYTDFQGAKARGGEAHVVGQWVRRNETQKDPGGNYFRFYVQDSTQHTELVTYNDPMPPNFQQAEKVVLIGGYQGNRFVADKILMKCPSKYNDQEGELPGAGQHPEGVPRGIPTSS